MEAFDIRATLTAALAIHPDTKYVYVINDYLPSMESKRDLADFTIDIPVEFSGNLSLCKEFAEKHGGKILVDSEPGKGRGDQAYRFLS